MCVLIFYGYNIVFFIIRNKEGVAKNAADIAHLLKMAKELENKSTEDEMKVSENNVTIENLTMNVAMQNRTVVNMMEDRKCLHQSY